MIGEDALTCAFGEQMIAQVLPRWSLARASINTRGITKLIPALPRYLQQAQYVQPVLCVADTDRKCPVELLKEWLPHGSVPSFLFRLAVSEAESWLLSDRESFAEFLGIPVRNLPADPDNLPDAKREVLRLARLSRNREVRNEVVSMLDPNKQGAGYNLHLCDFVQRRWKAVHASHRSRSLSKAVQRLAEFGASLT